MDDMQDYEYYEAHAKDVKLTAITSDEDNVDILARLRDNDPEFTSFTILGERHLYDEREDFVVQKGDHLGWLGYFVGKSKQLETLSIVDFPDNINLNAFLEGVGRNRSIKELRFCKDLGDEFQSLVPLMRNNDSLRHLGFNGFAIGLQCACIIAFLLGQSNSLKRLEIYDTGLDVEGLVEVVTALRTHTQIEELRLNSNNNLGRDGYVALGRMLEGWRNTRLSLLDVGYSDIEDEGLNALVAGLKHCHNLKSLNLNGNESITEAGLRSLSTLFHSNNCRLELLDLARMNIGDDGMSILAPGLASLPSLQKLNLYGNSIGDQGIQALVGALVNCNIEKLNISSNMLMDSVSGLRALGTLVARGARSMRSLSLNDCSVTAEGLQSFVDGMADCCSLTTLDLSFNHSITANGLACLSSLLRAEHCLLCTLDLYCSRHLGDDGAAALANGLIGNKSLTNLFFDFSGITATGWAAFSRLLCDTSNVKNTYLSNHTLERISEFSFGEQVGPQFLKRYLKWNKSLNQDAAICKILHSHPDIDVKPLFEFNLKCLPLVVAWLENAKPYLRNLTTYETTEYFQGRQLSSVYKFIRGMPQLAVDGYHMEKTKAKKKRKFDLTM